MDKNLKEQAENLFSELGMNMTTAFTVFVRQSVRQGKIPFEISLNARESETEAHMTARKKFGDAIKSSQDQSIINGTSEMAIDEINNIISESRSEKSVS